MHTMNSPREKVNTMHRAAINTEKNQKEFIFHTWRTIKRETNNKKRNESMLCMNLWKIFSVTYWLSKKEIALSTFNSLLLLLESIGVEDIKDFSTRLPSAIRDTAMELSEVIKSDLVKKIEIRSLCSFNRRSNWYL